MMGLRSAPPSPPVPAAPEARVPMRWWGWGTDGHDAPIPAAAAGLMERDLGWDPAAPRHEPPALAEVVLPEPALSAAARAALEAVAGPGRVSSDHATRVLRAAGRSYPDLLELRSGRLATAPDAVVTPGSPDEVQRVLAACAEHDVAVVPFGGGTSVVGGVAALRGAHHAVIALDLRRLDAVVDVDARSRLATLQAGLTGPAAEAALARHDLTLGHLPQSFEFSTVGGWVATRSAGQASAGYGRIDALVAGLRAATPAGPLEARALPATAAGPDLRELLVGSEGTLGVLTEVTLRVAPRHGAQAFAGYSLPGFAAAQEALRALAQAGVAPTVTRASDEDETRINLAMAGSARDAGALRAYLRARGHGRPCLIVLGWDAPDARALGERRRTAGRVLRRHGAVALGGRVGQAWASRRFHGPYLRDELLSRGILVDTLETAATWDALPRVYAAVGAALRAALAARGTPAAVGCHVSHVYPDGASLYFTFLARQEHGAELEQWHAAKAAASDAIAAAGGTITHHHAVGRDHAPWLGEEIGALGLDVLRALKARLDPTGIMNPGKLVAPR